MVSSVLFPCPTPSYSINSFPGELAWIPRQIESASANSLYEGGGAGTGEPEHARYTDAETSSIPCLLLPFESARYLIIFFHSNAEDLGRCRWFCHFLRDQFQVHVLAVEYPGYGVCGGFPSKDGVITNAVAAVNFAITCLRLELDQIKVFGRSIGTGPALHIASRFKVAGVVLVTPFQSIRKLFRDRIGFLSYFVEEWFDNEAEAANVCSPTLIVHGQRDLIIPCCHGEAIFKTLRTRKIFVNPENMEHNSNLARDMAFLVFPMFRFFALPDYSFQEFQIPAWLFDKRRSIMYSKPLQEVSARSESVVGGHSRGGVPGRFPQGDEEQEPIDTEKRLGSQVFCTSNRELTAPLTHPTVRYEHEAPKRVYDFTAPAPKVATCTGLEDTRLARNQPEVVARASVSCFNGASCATWDSIDGTIWVSPPDCPGFNDRVTAIGACSTSFWEVESAVVLDAAQSQEYLDSASGFSSSSFSVHADSDEFFGKIQRRPM